MTAEDTTARSGRRSASHGVLIVNLASGGGKASRFDLVGHCRDRGIDAVVFESGDDLSEVAADAVSRGCDVLGMAGGDGSQAAVAAVAAEHDLPYVCVPAGTRNHFAFDIGVDRRDVAAALDAYFDADERRIDIARVNGRVFLNNVAMGVYGAIVESDDYRAHKVRTAIAKLADVLAPDAEPFDLRFVDGQGRAHDSADLIVVSNNRYAPERRPRHGTRGALDQGVLGVIAVSGPPPRGLAEWTTPKFAVASSTTVAVGVDGESVHVDPPLVFESMPLALRVRMPVVRSRGVPRLRR
ncbi:MAG: diacylglycerol/lipid kinase family protein [Acidimicrobiales bacterium]